MFELVRVSFIAREPVSSTKSYYSWDIQEPGNNGGEGNRTRANVRRGQRIVLAMMEPIPGTGPAGAQATRGIYHGTISYMPNVGKSTPKTPPTPPETAP